MSTAGNILIGISKKLKKTFSNPYEKIGLSWLQVRKLKNTPEGIDSSSPFLGYNMHFRNREEFLHGVDELFFKEIYKTNFAVPAPYIIDCGAHIGLSVVYFKTQYPQSAVVAFEPDASNFELLKKNVASMQLSNVDLRQEAVWIEDKTLQFSSEGSMSSRIGEPAHKAKTIDVKAIRLYDMLAKKVDLLKIDIEGAEYPVMKDIEPRLENVDRLFLEYHGRFEENNKLQELLEMLTRNGFYYTLNEASMVYPTPFDIRHKAPLFDVQLNIYCFKKHLLQVG
ncbi:FkbM family methyltransferase [uncultured Chitinophaga sp.]|uniref:FkbM family methyltransferase n=1 Tax=uncultured Chitinophaga sp. TaxID=339340 RepID=UPI0025F9F4BF|nr:FkbM family methyltransferase [uncultured Chitinophaga sp.]